MSQTRKMPFSKFIVFSEAFNVVRDSFQSISRFQQLQIVFDSFLKLSIKDS